MDMDITYRTCTASRAPQQWTSLHLGSACTASPSTERRLGWDPRFLALFLALHCRHITKASPHVFLSKANKVRIPPGSSSEAQRVAPNMEPRVAMYSERGGGER